MSILYLPVTVKSKNCHLHLNTANQRKSRAPGKGGLSKYEGEVSTEYLYTIYVIWKGMVLLLRLLPRLLFALSAGAIELYLL